MANFDLVTATKVIPEFQGSQKELNNFLGLIEFYHNTLKDITQKGTLIKFVLATKLSEKVKNKIQTENTPTTFDEFRQILKSSYKSNKNAFRLHSEISQSYQGNQNVSVFSSRIEHLLASLNDLQISEQGEAHRETIVKLNDQIVLAAFKNGLSEPYKSLVMAARPTKLAEAVQIALEVSPQHSNNIMFFNREQRGRNNFRGNYNRRINDFNRDRHQNHGNNNRYENQNRSYNNNRGGHNNQNNNRQHFQGNGYVPGRQNPGHTSRRR